jgi:hypothetical protein
MEEQKNKENPGFHKKQYFGEFISFIYATGEVAE